MRDFLENLKVGDKVGTDVHYHGLSLLTVERITKTMIITNKGRFNKIDGKKVGDTGWHSLCLREVTEEFLKKYYRQEYTRYIKNLVSNNKLELLELDELKEIYSKLKLAISK